MTKYSIWKWTVPLKDVFYLSIPKGTQILNFQTQRDGFCLWGLVLVNAATEEKEFRLFGTGHEMPDNILTDFTYIGTALALNDDFVGHLFEKKK